MGSWGGRVRNLGDAFFEVLQAEIEALLIELQSTGKGWLKSVLLAVVAAVFSFWAVGVLTAFLNALLSTRVGTWQAAGIVFLVLGLTSGGFAFWAWKTFRRERGPVVVVRGHMADHLAWWQKNMTAEGPTLEPRSVGADAGSTKAGPREAGPVPTDSGATAPSDLPEESLQEEEP